MPGYLSPVSLLCLAEGTLATVFEVTAIVNWSTLVGAVCDVATVACCIPSDTSSHARLGVNSLPVAGKDPQASDVTCSFNFRKCLKRRLIRKTV